MPSIISFLLGGLIQIAGSLVGRVLLALGLGFVEYAGMQTLFNSVKSKLAGMASALSASASMLEWAGFLRIDVHLSIIISAVGVKMLLNSLNSDRVRRIVSK